MLPPTSEPDEALAALIVDRNVVLHEHEAPTYDLAHPELSHAFARWVTRRDLAMIRRAVEHVARPLALDVAAGTGRLALILCRMGFDVIAVDNSPAMLAVLKLKYERMPEPKGTLEIVLSSADDFSLHHIRDRALHLVTFGSALHHLPYYVRTLDRLASLVAEGGVVYVSHEPLPVQAERPTAEMRLVKYFDRFVLMLQRMRKAAVKMIRRRASRPATKPSAGGPSPDYYDGAGLDIQRIRAVLSRLGYAVLAERHYKDRKTALAAILDTFVFKTPNWLFNLVAQRRIDQ
jgi:ubiquinone/menaquinone biosynthesis C-methylase UbiE